MWLLPPDFPLRPFRLAPDCRALPWYATELEVEQLMELLRRMVPEIREWIRVPWSVLGKVSGLSEVREGAALVVAAPKELVEADARGMVSQVRWPYVFWRPPEPSEEHGAWLEREVKRALLSELRQGLASEAHPLRELGIERLPVDIAAAATDDPVELLAIVQGAVTHRLEHVDEGTRAEDWTYSVRRAIGQQLAMRLGRVEDKSLTRVLEVVLSEEQRPEEARAEAGRQLQAVGLGMCVGETVALGPLARSTSDPVVYGVLLERLPTELWPTDTGKRHFLGPMLLRAHAVASPPPIRLASPTSIHYPQNVLKALAELEERAKALPSGREAAEDVLRSAWLAPLLLAHAADDETLRSFRDGRGHNLRVLDQIHLEDPEQRALVSLLRLLAEPILMEDPPDIAAHLQRIEGHALLLGSHSKSLISTIANSIKLFAAIVLLSRCRDHGRLQELSDCADAERRAKKSMRKRESESNIGYWMSLQAEVLRLRGLSASAARWHQAALSAQPENRLGEGRDWGRWELARARREAGYAALAFSELHWLRSRLHLHREEVVPLEHELLLELAHIEFERGSTAKAHGYYTEVGKQLEKLPFSRTAIRADAFDCAVQIAEGSTTGVEPRLRQLHRKAETVGDLRLLLLVEFVLGDFLVHTHRYDGARAQYALGHERAIALGDQLGQACALEKLATLAEIVGRAHEAVEQLVRGAELDAMTEHHVSAARQFRRAAELAEQQGSIEQAADLRARAVEQALVTEQHEIDIVQWAERRKGSASTPPVATAEPEDVQPAKPSEEEPLSS